jgi:hypothetical protein
MFLYKEVSSTAMFLKCKQYKKIIDEAGNHSDN